MKITDLTRRVLAVRREECRMKAAGYRIPFVKAAHSSLIVTRNMPGGIAPTFVGSRSANGGLHTLMKKLTALSVA
ncbi:hypothetical protein AYJ54_07665 [Bradyrhizobium centrolobii]|uniref:Uncharacterized protein n=1 Tax=Bradyrhizobium centrolobii TaxID=1505087 RepID=A0A176YX11_9BRAD|nr:hypothetical protein [Bradyrhizobium centrolobii]OAF11734.1 hypothetical protein AYJ54_07665 [Bradyrhizobium centrolobii]